MNLGGLHFLHPGWLLLLPVCWVLSARLVTARGPSIWQQTMDAHLYQHLTGATPDSLPRTRNPLALGTLLSLLTVALAGPSWYHEKQAVVETANARVIVLSLSATMRIRDGEPDRLSQARQAALSLLQTQFDGETALVVYAGASFIVAPLTRDASTLERFLSVLTINTMPIDGRRLDSAIERANSLLQSAVAGNGHIIVIADGADNHDQVERAIASSVKRGSKVSVIAVGTEYGGPQPDANGKFLRDANGRAKIIPADWTTLASLARAGGGEFSHANRTLDETIASVSARTHADANRAGEQQLRRVDGGFWLAIIAIPLMLWQFRRHAVLLSGLLVLTPIPPAAADGGKSLWFNPSQQAYRAYLRGDFETAVAISHDDLLTGTALLQSGDYTRAAQVLADLTQSPTALYNRANALVAAQRFDEARVAYRAALQIDPHHADAKINLQRLELWLATLDSTPAGGDDENPTPEEEQAAGGELDMASRGSRQGEGSDRTVDGEQPGSGAGLGQGRIDAEDNTDGLAVDLERLLARLKTESREDDHEWLQQLTDRQAKADPAELLKRKFLRDHLRNTERAR